jgi:hypothetical protein
MYFPLRDRQQNQKRRAARVLMTAKPPMPMPMRAPVESVDLEAGEGVAVAVAVTVAVPPVDVPVFVAVLPPLDMLLLLDLLLDPVVFGSGCVMVLV